MNRTRTPEKHGLYDPQWEHDACGIGFVANIRGDASHDVIRKGIEVLENLNHRGAAGCESGAGTHQGSSELAAAIASRPILRSATLRAIGPETAVSCAPM